MRSARACRRGILAGVQAARQDTKVRAIVVIGAGKTFIAGADIREFAEDRGR